MDVDNRSENADSAITPTYVDTEPDCFSTVIDSDSDACADEKKSGDECSSLCPKQLFHDNLQNLLDRQPDDGCAEEKKKKKESECPSLSQNSLYASLLHLWSQVPDRQPDADDWMDVDNDSDESPFLAPPIFEWEKRPNPVSIPWHCDPNVVSAIDDLLEPLEDATWFDAACFERTWGKNAQASLQIILTFFDERLQHYPEFKIGIAADPKHRWHRSDCGHSRNYDKMFLVYAAKRSNPALPESSGAMERALISHLRDSHPGCQNIAPGGEGPSKVSPHFTYIVVR